MQPIPFTESFLARLLYRTCFSILVTLPTLSAFAQDTATKPVPSKTIPSQPAPDKPFDPADFVIIQKGSLPFILSAPHGGNFNVPDAQSREGAGQSRKPGNFVTARDTRTTELALAVSKEIERRYGKKPYLVASLAHRRFLDPNRPADIAYEHPNAGLIFKQYHGALEVATKEVFETFHTGLLLDIHGQGSKSDVVFRGTKDGLTVKLLQERHGAAAHTGQKACSVYLPSVAGKFTHSHMMGKNKRALVAATLCSITAVI